MSSLQQLFTSRKPYAASTFVAGKGKLFYDEISGALRIGDGTTPGGHLISYPVASSTQLGGIKLGPGVTTNIDGQIIIDSAGLDFSFGDFTSVVGTYAEDYPDVTRQNVDYALLSSINPSEDIVIASTGVGVVRIIGEFSVRHTDGSFDAVLADESVFRVTSDGQVRMLVASQDSTTGAVSIIGSDTGAFISPVNTGVMLHVTGNYASPGIPSRIYNDSQNAFAAFVARRFNGTVAAPTQVLADEEILRLSGTAHNGTIIPGTGNQRIVYRALGNQTLTNQGGSIELWTTPVNTTTIAKIATVDSVGITLESGKVLTGIATTATYARSFNTGTLITNAVTAVTAGTVTTAAQPAITSVGTLTSLSVTNLVTAKNYSGQARDAGTLGAGGTLVIDFATDYNVLVNLTTTAVIGFVNTSSGKTVTVMVKNATGNNRAVTLGVVAGNTSNGNAAPNVNDGRTGVIVYRSFGTATTDVYCEFN